MKSEQLKKKHGFRGQLLIVIPKRITSEFLSSDPLTNQLYITDIGYFPKARFHHIERPNGVNQHIIIYCTEGNGWIEVNNTWAEIHPSQFVIIPAGLPHKYGAAETDPWTIYWLHFKGSAAAYAAELLHKGSKNYTSPVNYHENRIQLFKTICFHLERGYSRDNLRYVNMLFSHFLSSLLFEDKFNTAADNKNKDVIDVVIEQMQQNINMPLSLKELAAFANLSVSHFSAVFREKTGYPPMEYFTHLKVQKACQYLLLTNIKIKDISEELGIADHYYFSRMFTKIMGTSPNHYRKRQEH